MEEYVFKIIKKNIIQEKDYFKFKYDIKVVITRCAILYLRLEISRHIKDSRFRLESLFLSHNEKFDYLDSINQGILRGYFEFSEEDNAKAWSSLSLILNGEYKPDNFGKKWSDFKVQFVDWYNKLLKPKAEANFSLMKEQDIQ